MKKRKSWAVVQVGCKCGNPSVGRELVTYYTKKDGTVSTYVQKEMRCQKCINKSKQSNNGTNYHKRRNTLIEGG